MATFSGTYRADTITPDLVSAGVVRTPAGARPSAIADRIDGGNGNDILDGGGGRDTINGGDGHDTIALTAAGGTVHGDGGDDEITITPDLVWSRVSAEPDSHAVGTSLSYAFPGARLSVTGEPGTTVIAANGIIEDPGPGAPSGPHDFATTGTVLFGQDPADAPGGGWGQGMPLWNADEFGELRVDFDRPTDLVSIDFAFDDDDVASLKAFSAGGVLLEEVTGSGRGPETFTGTIARDTPDISYITAGGVDREALYLDNLRYYAPVASEDVSATVYGDAGNDRIDLRIIDTGGDNNVNHAAYGGEGNDTLTVYYEGMDDTFTGWLGNSPNGSFILRGGAGNDTIGIFAGGDTAALDLTANTTALIYGDAGDDVLGATGLDPDLDGSFWPGNNTERLYGGTGNDKFRVFEQRDLVFENPGEGIDTVVAWETDYVLPANVENLEMAGYYGNGAGFRGTGNALANTIIVEGEYVDPSGCTLNGAAGNDVIYGCTGANDVIDGGSGNDTLYGKLLGQNWDLDDADVIRGGTGNDLIYGGGGDQDTWDGDDRLYGDDGNDRIFGSFGNDVMDGGTGDDELGGQAGNDTMYGGAGRDRLGGGSGNDALYGDADADVLSGREGLDQLRGGAGNDIFDYDAVTDSRPGAANRDVIFDFTGVGGAVGDRIDLSTIDANTSAGGNQAFVFRGTAAFTGAGQVRVLASGADTLIQANTGGSLAPEMEVLVKDGSAPHTRWIGGDFIL